MNDVLKIIVIILTVIWVIAIIDALPVIIAILFLVGSLIWSILTGSQFWEGGPFW